MSWKNSRQLAVSSLLPGAKCSSPSWSSASTPLALIRAIEECFPRSARQRCLAHKLRNLQSKMPEDQWPEFKARAIACYQAASPVLARMLRDDIAASYGAAVPSALACLQDDFDACIVRLRFPLAHRRSIRTTNLLERLFGEERRPNKAIPHAFGERAVLKLMYAALIRAAERWRGLRTTEFEDDVQNVSHS